MRKNDPLYQLQVYCYDTREELGRCAAAQAAHVVNRLLEEKEYVRIIFAAAPSQNEFLEAFSASDIDFSRIIAFHMDEYVGLAQDDPASFATYLRTHIFSKAVFKQVYYLNGKAENIEAECECYTRLLKEEPIDVVLMGIGENGHIAFNDPGEADFTDPHSVKRVRLDDVCRMQQVHDKCFPNLDAVPKYAMTLTVPMLQSASHHFCMVPSSLKAEAVRRTLHEKIDPACPATIIRKCKDMHLYLDRDSASLL